MEHRTEPDAPWILIRAIPDFTDEHGHTSVDGLGEFRIAAGSDDRAGTGVGVQERDVLRRKREPAIGIICLLDGTGEEHELGAARRGPHASSGSEKTELLVAADVGEETVLVVLEVQQADQRPVIDDFLKEELGRIVGGDPGRKHAADAATLIDQISHRFSEHGIEIDVPSSAQRITTASAEQVPPSGRVSLCVEKATVEHRFVGLQRPDHPLARGGGRGARDLRPALCEPLLFHELDPLPRRVAEHAVEAAVLEDLREPEFPVKEPILAGQTFDGPVLCGSQGVGVVMEAPHRVGR